jgi:hypothetical protein
MDMDKIEFVLGTIGCMALSFFWLSQLVRVALLDGRFIRSPMEKLLWFFFVLFGNLIGAVCFFVWRRRKAREITDAANERCIAAIAETISRKS